MIEIRESSIPNAGIGVWSTRLIPKDSLITEYYGEHLNEDEYLLFKVKSLQHFSKERLHDLNRRLLYTKTSDEISVFGDPDSRDVSKCGQLINDRFTILSFIDNSNEISMQELLTYEEESIAQSSVYCLYTEGKLLCYASNDILPNQELFHSYGIFYWLRYFGLKAPKEFNIYNLTNTLIDSTKLKKLLTKSNV